MSSASHHQSRCAPPPPWRSRSSRYILIDVKPLGERLLILLLEEMPTTAFERAMQDSLEETREEEESAAARRQVNLGLQLRSLLDRYKHRAAELTALYDTAGDLSSLRDVENVLQAIIRRGRQLLGTDVAYLMLLDEDRVDAYMRVTEGTVTSDFINIRLPLGVGLGGLVAETAAPHWTANYLDDHSYLHAIDETVESEGLLAILGVPLKIGRRVIGVLFAADRRPRSFAPEEVSLLSSLAAHAAIALENASLFQDAQAGLRRLTSVMTVIEQHNAALERASDMHERLTSLVVAGGADSDIAGVVVGLLGGALLMLNADGKLVASAGTRPGSDWAGAASTGPGNPEAVPTVERLIEMAAASRRLVSAAVKGAMCHVAPVIAGADFLGSLVFVGPQLGDADTRALERAATVTALLRLNQRARDEAENRVRGELLAELLTANVRDEPALQRRAALVGVDLTRPMTIVVAVPDANANPGRVRAEAAALARSEHGLVIAQADGVVLLVPGSDAREVARSVAGRLGQASGSGVTAGAVGPLSDLALVADSERQASRCARALCLLGREGQGATPDELGFYGLLLSESAQYQVSSFVEAALGRLEHYDNERGTALLNSVAQFFEHDGNVNQAAQALFVHPNTLYQRLDRIDRILGSQWRTGDQALEIRLALRLRKLKED